ncbi:MAG: hypothetical protein F6K39_35675, partial [Okeania sp. SIO3B3]|nr:hypothetical protein [Okeania sp. SIO3B3]
MLTQLVKLLSKIKSCTLSEYTHHVSQGDFSATIDYRANDPIGDTARDIEQLVATLK